jgi:carbon storage regulator
VLVLTRRNGECLRIGSDVRVVVLSASGQQVRLGIEAPAHVAVHREEVYERIAQANTAAASSELPDALLAAIDARRGEPGDDAEGGER